MNIYAAIPVTLQHTDGEPHFPAQPLASGKLQALAAAQSQCPSWDSALHGCASATPWDWELLGAMGDLPRGNRLLRADTSSPLRALLWTENGLKKLPSLRQISLRSRAASLCKEAQIWRWFPCQEWPKGPVVPGAQ